MAESLLGQPSGVRQRVVIHKYQRGLERLIKSKLSRIRYKISVGDESEIIVRLITGKLACSQRPLRVAKEVFSMPTSTFGNVVVHIRQTNALNQDIIKVLEAVNTLRNRNFGHGTTAPFDLKSPDVDFTYLTCIGGILLFARI